MGSLSSGNTAASGEPRNAGSDRVLKTPHVRTAPLGTLSRPAAETEHPISQEWGQGVGSVRDTGQLAMNMGSQCED
jgi:hypothetical protein